MTTMLVASIGGHLTELHLLRNAISGPVVWITNDSPQSRSLLAGEDVVWVPYVAPRDWATAAKLLPTGHRLARRPEIERVISTGSAVAVPFLVASAARGRETIYVESATRSEGPSLTGRIVSCVPRVQLRTQSPNWAGRRWKYAGSILDVWESTAAPPPEIRRVVVSLGTIKTFQFRSLVERLVQVLPPHVEVLWQVGSTAVGDLAISGVRESVPAAELRAAIEAADVVVAHAGAGIALTAMELGKCPVLVPRRAARYEHVDDHQQQIARQLEQAGVAVVAEVEQLSWEHLERAAARRTIVRDRPPLDLWSTGR